MLIRDAVASDFEEVTAIYNSIVLTSTAIYNDQPATLQDRIDWWKSCISQGYPFLVAVPDGGNQDNGDAEGRIPESRNPENGHPESQSNESQATDSPAPTSPGQQDSLLGYATFGDFRPWPGYRRTVEGTLHIRDNARGRGIGTRLLTELTARAAKCGKHMMVAGVDSENAASLRFLERFGFKHAGRLREVGFKFDRYLDLCFLQYELSGLGHQSSTST